MLNQWGLRCRGSSRSTTPALHSAGPFSPSCCRDYHFTVESYHQAPIFCSLARVKQAALTKHHKNWICDLSPGGVAGCRQVVKSCFGCQHRKGVGRRPLLTTCMASKLQFIKGVDEPSVPDVKLTRSRDGSSGTATFVFTDPAVLNTTEELGEITGLYMIDDEGTIQTVDVSAKFVNGKPERIEAVHVMRNTASWDRFMRFMERYAEDNELGFNKVGCTVEPAELSLSYVLRTSKVSVLPLLLC